MDDNFILVLLYGRSLDFVDCDEPVDLKGNKTAKEELGFGCLKVHTILIRHIFI